MFNVCQVLFVYMDVSTENEDNQRVMEFFPVTTSDTPAYRLIEFGTDPLVKYQPDTGDVTSSAIQSFVQSYLDGTIAVRITSNTADKRFGAFYP